MAEPFTTNDALNEFGNFPKRAILHCVAGWLGAALTAIGDFTRTFELLMTWPFVGFEASAIFGLVSMTTLIVIFYNGAIIGQRPCFYAFLFGLATMISALPSRGGEIGALLGNYALFVLITITIGILILRKLRQR